MVQAPGRLIVVDRDSQGRLVGEISDVDISITKCPMELIFSGVVAHMRPTRWQNMSLNGVLVIAVVRFFRNRNLRFLVILHRLHHHFNNFFGFWPLWGTFRKFLPYQDEVGA